MFYASYKGWNFCKFLGMVWLMVFAIACDEIPFKNEPVETNYPVFLPTLKDTLYYRDYIADVHSVQHVEMRSRVSGYVEDIYVDEGKLVKKGQLLFTITSQGHREELMKAKASHKKALAEAKKAELNYYNAKLLADKEVISQTEVEMALAELDAANAKVAEAKSQMISAQLALSYTRIKAPFEGVINRIPYKKGSLIDEGILLTTISDNTEVFVYFNMSEKEFLEFTEFNKGPLTDNKVSFILANNKKLSVDGYVETAEGEVTKETGTIAFRARFTNPDNLLKHGSSGKIRMTKKLKDALLIPQKSTFEIQDKTYVYVLDSANTVTSRSVVPKFRLSNFYVLESGLSPSERIIYEGIQTVKEGLVVTPDTVSFQQVKKELL